MNAIKSSFIHFALPATLLLMSHIATAQEFRGVWCSRFQWASTNPTTAQNNINNTMNNMVTGHFNSIFFQIRGQCETFYPSPDEPWSLSISSNNTNPGWNPLQYAVDAAHTRGLELHAYFNTHTIWSGATNAPPISTMPNHVYYLHGNPNDSAHQDWLLFNAAGAPTTYTTGVDEYLWMNPGVPAADAWVRKQAVHIVTNYDVDGLHFDRIRMPAVGYGKNPIAVARWDNPVTPTANDGPGNPDQLDWDSFMRDAVTRHVMNISGECWGIKRLMPLSSSPLGLWEYSTYYQSLGGYSSGFNWGYRRAQDAKAWMQMGAQDFIVPQIYWANGGSKPDFNEVYNDWLAAANLYGRFVVGGANNSVGQTEVESNCNYVRSQGGNGKGSNLWQSANTLFSTWSAAGHPYQTATPATPTFPWRDTEGVIAGKMFTDSSLTVPVIDAWITRNGSTWTALSSGDGFFTFLRVPPGTYTLTSIHPVLGTSTLNNVVVAAGQATNVTMAFGGPDTTPPVISNVSAGNITDTAATITWNTNEASDSVVEYGLTTSYGSTVSNASMVVNHSLNLASLSASTLYHYRVKSKDAALNQATSGDFTFTTNAAGSVSDIIIDNPSATVVGTWSTGTTAADKFGSDYRYKSQGTGSAYLQYTPQVLTAGNYQVYEWHPQGSNRTSAAPIQITFNGGSQTVALSQQSSGGTWILLGTWNFAAGAGGHVRIRDDFPDAGQVVMADAIKLVYSSAPPTPPAAPSNLTATAVSTSQINLSWTDNSSNEANFVVARSSTTGGPYTDIQTLGANVTTYSDTGLAASTTYFYVVRATNTGGSSANSNQASATTQTPPSQPAAPSNLTATAVSKTQVNLTWTDNSSNETNFVVEYKKSTDSTWLVGATLGANATSHVQTGLKRNTTYNFRVKATNASGSSPYSATATATTLP